MTTPKLPNDSTIIKLTKGQESIIDAEDFAKVSEYNWYTLKQPNYQKTRYVAQTCVKQPDGKWKTIYLHRFLIDAPKGLMVDHINGDTLDNRKANLRLCTNGQNQRNRNRMSNNQSGFKGVCYVEKHNFYTASIQCEGKKIHLGTFSTAESAFEAYKAAAKKMHGEFAKF